jgi:hypothetical protein
VMPAGQPQPAAEVPVPGAAGAVSPCGKQRPPCKRPHSASLL